MNHGQNALGAHINGLSVRTLHKMDEHEIVVALVY